MAIHALREGLGRRRAPRLFDQPPVARGLLGRLPDVLLHLVAGGRVQPLLAGLMICQALVKSLDRAWAVGFGATPAPLSLTLTQFFLLPFGFGECLALTLFPSLHFLLFFGFGECLALTLFPSLPKSVKNIKSITLKTKMYSVCTVGPSFSPCKQHGFSW